VDRGDDVGGGAASARVTRRTWRAPLLAAAMLSMAYGVWLGLLRLGWALPLPRTDHLILHGPLMIGGFLGTLISLERAIGIARPWAWAAPIASAAGGAALVFGVPEPAGPCLFVLASAVVTAVFVTVVVREPTLFSATMLAGAVMWLAGNVLWASGFAIYRVVFWWIAFVVLTIAGERLELTRVLRPPPLARVTFAAAVAIVVAGVAEIGLDASAGVRVTGAGLLVLTLWLASHDVARRTIKQSGLTRYIAVCLLSGYVWLALASVIAVWTGAYEPGVVHDALLHAVFLGFVVSMIFGHAPIVLPAVTGRPLAYRPALYLPLAILHFSVGLRLVGDMIEELARWRAWGGLFNAASMLVFAGCVAQAFQPPRRNDNVVSTNRAAASPNTGP